ncbi:glutamate receptor ionotropic, kainate glr-3-like [Oratosquilla oratoria]|uniref:glutamate receptor ionotropic, kainate glr-3-like n=1 Tax=Oratosquilla oratoria TaxID=337810 RepID=UPI003F76E5B4
MEWSRAGERRCLTVAIEEFPPMVMYRGDKWHGIMTYFFEMFLQRFKYCYKFVRPTDRLWGIRLANGSFNGMMGMLERNEVDIALGPFGVSRERLQLADMSDPFMFMDHRIIYPRPKVEPDLRGFYRPFSPESWIITFSTLMAVFLCLFAIAIITKLAMSDRLQEHPPTLTNLFEEGGRIIRWTYGILLSQSMPWTPSQGSGLVLLWIMFSFILSTIYKCNLKAMLILPKVEPITHRVEDTQTRKTQNSECRNQNDTYSSLERIKVSLKILIETLIHPGMEHPSIAWAPHRVKDLSKIKTIQRAATKPDI